MKTFGKKEIVTGLFMAATVFAAEAKDLDVKCRVELNRNVVFADKVQKVIVKVGLVAPRAPRVDERPPVNLTIVLDRSGSMSGKKIQKAKEAAIAALRRLSPKDIFSLVTYDTNIKTVVPAQSAANLEWIESQIRSISTGGNTALFGGVSQGASEIRKHLNEKYIHRIILLSDGLANSGPSSPEELGRLGRALSKEGISVTTMGIGTDYNEDLMAELAQRSDGNTYFVESSADLPRIFSAELGDVLSVVASKVKLKVTFPAGVRPLRIIGRDGRIGNQLVEISLNQLYGGQEKYVLVEVSLPAGAEGDLRKVASASCNYQNMILNQPAIAQGNVQIRYTKKEALVNSGVNAKVEIEVVRNNIAVSNIQAMQAADKQDFNGAAMQMTRNAQVLSRYAKKYNNPALKKEADELKEKAINLQQRQSFSKSDRKDLKTRSYETFNQQKSGK